MEIPSEEDEPAHKDDPFNAETEIEKWRQEQRKEKLKIADLQWRLRAEKEAHDEMRSDLGTVSAVGERLGPSHIEVDEQRVETEVTYENVWTAYHWAEGTQAFLTKRIVWPLTGTKYRLEEILEFRHAREDDPDGLIVVEGEEKNSSGGSVSEARNGYAEVIEGEEMGDAHGKEDDAAV